MYLNDKLKTWLGKNVEASVHQNVAVCADGKLSEVGDDFIMITDEDGKQTVINMVFLTDVSKEED